MKQLLILISTALLLLTACHKDDKPDFTERTASRSVLIYMSGENNLTVDGGTRFLNNDLEEIIEGSKYLADNQRLFLFVDSLGANKSQKGKPYIIEVHGGQTYPRVEYESDFYACDPDRFHDIVSWMTTNIKAEGYGLVLWGHASGWTVEKDSIPSSSRAYGLDEYSDQGVRSDKWMNITQMATALKGLPKLDFIFCDCCNMMCAEVGYELRNATHYLIGSPAEIPGDGAPYNKIVPQLYKNGAELYKGIIDTYFDDYLYSYPTSYPSLTDYSVPLSVIRTQNIEELARMTKDIVGTFATNHPEQLDLSKLPFYFGYDTPAMYDMQGVVKRFAEPAVYQAWLAVFKAAVPYARISKQWMTIYKTQLWAFPYFEQDDDYWGCVSMFVPQTNYQYSHYNYNTTANNYGWNRIIDWSRFGW